MFSRFFIERPIFATVVSILLCLAGVAAMLVLPIEQYPTITPVQITVSATYPGADSRTLAESVAAPIEAQITGVENMIYMSSTSSATGQLSITVFFSLDTDADAAQVQVQNRVNLALPQLPSAVTQLGVSVQKKSSSIMMLLAVTGKGGRYSDQYIANYANVYVLDTIKRVPGAGQAAIMGVPDQALRIWLNPERMASLGITTTDIQQAVAGQNALFGAGQLGQAPGAGRTELTLPVVMQRPATDPAQYDQIILRASQDGSALVRLKDVARAEVGLRQYVIDSRLDGAPATFIAVYQQAGANGLKVSEAVRAALAEMKSRFPEGIDAVVALDTNEFVRIAIDEVVHTLVEAVVLVVLIVYLFLQSLRTTVICLAAIVVSLVATFAGMLALGFSINLLTLFGLVLAIGLVVDDAIVVVENVERNMAEHHLPPREATIRAMGEISGALVAVVLVMAAVFVPAAFLPGTTGQIYRQFAITIVVSLAVSGLVALTLTPALCALMLKHQAPRTRGFFGWFNRGVDRVTGLFGRAVVFLIRRLAVAAVLLAVLVYAIFHLFRTLPTSFVPNEDQGYVMALALLPGGASLDRARDVSEKVDALFAADPAVESRSQLIGYSLLDGGFKTNAATLFVTLKDFAARYESIETARAQNPRSVLTGVYKTSASVEEAMVIPVAPPPIPGIGSTGGFELWIQDTAAGDPARLEEAVQAFVARARQRPELAAVNTTFRASLRQLRVDVDRDKALLLGVPVQDVYGAIQAQFGSLVVSQFNQFSRVWQVVLQSDPVFRRKPEDIGRLYTRSQQGDMVPLSTLVTTRWVTGPDVLPRFNGFPAAKVNGGPAAGYSSGQALAALQEVARESLPPGFTTAWSGLAYEETRAGGASAMVFALGLLVVFLVLAAQYESWRLPLAVMTAIPFGVLGALVANHLRGLQNDVYFQIGLLVLIGLGAKNAILRVTAAVDLRRQGRTVMQATIEAGEQRLRPIIMTSLAFGAGVLPLVVAMGAGANARHSIGTGILGGMIGETTLAMLYVPVFFYLLERFAQWQERRRAARGGAAPADPPPASEAVGGGPGAPPAQADTPP
ncbi:MAG: efflux RND transporter permease subunit [Betaproteobacteria bacterium]